MVDTNDHCLAAFDVRDNPQALATAVKNYPELVREPKQPTDKKATGNRKNNKVK